jgi:hypothetical protein
MVHIEIFPPTRMALLYSPHPKERDSCFKNVLRVEEASSKNLTQYFMSVQTPIPQVYEKLGSLAYI